nr:protein CEBPZOS [Podarcis muralis]
MWIGSTQLRYTATYRQHSDTASPNRTDRGSTARTLQHRREGTKAERMREMKVPRAHAHACLGTSTPEVGLDYARADTVLGAASGRAPLRLLPAVKRRSHIWRRRELGTSCAMNPELGRKIFKGVILVEIIGVASAYALYVKMDNNQDFRQKMHRRYPSILEVYYKCNEYAGFHGKREKDQAAWLISKS